MGDKNQNNKNNLNKLASDVKLSVRISTPLIFFTSKERDNVNEVDLMVDIKERIQD